MKRRITGWTVLSLIILLLTAGCSDAQQQEAYTPEKAKEHGDVVSYGGNESEQVSNLPKLLKFVERVKKGEEANVQLAIFNKGSAAVINQLIYNGEKIRFTINSLGNNKEKTTVCKGINAEESGYFTLTGCSGKEDQVTVLGVSAYAYKKAMLETGN